MDEKRRGCPARDTSPCTSVLSTYRINIPLRESARETLLTPRGSFPPRFASAANNRPRRKGSSDAELQGERSCFSSLSLSLSLSPSPSRRRTNKRLLRVFLAARRKICFCTVDGRFPQRPSVLARCCECLAFPSPPRRDDKKKPRG